MQRFLYPHYAKARPIAWQQSERSPINQFEKHNLICKVRASGVHHPAVLDAIKSIDRTEFVGNQLSAGYAHRDTCLAINCGQTTSQPSIVGLMTQAIMPLTAHSKILEIGTGSGYQAAILGRLARYVYTMERHQSLAIEAEQRLRSIGCSRVLVNVGDGHAGLPRNAPFDRIIVTATTPVIPPALLQQLTVGGIMVLPLGDAERVQNLTKITKHKDGLKSVVLCQTCFVPMLVGVNAEE